MGRGQHFVGSRNLQLCSALARKIRSGFAWFRLPRNSATKKQSDALFHGQIMEHLCSLWSRWESRIPCQCCLAKRSGLVFGVRSAAIKKNQNYVSDRDWCKLFASRKVFKLSFVCTVETNWLFLHSKNPRKILFSVSSQLIITKKTINILHNCLLIPFLHELPGKPWPNPAWLQAGSNALLCTILPN